MGRLIFHPEKMTPQLIKELQEVCPFGALKEVGEGLEAGDSCRMCRLCIRHGNGAVTEEEQLQKKTVEKQEWEGIAVFADYSQGQIHPVSLELIGKARELARVTGHPVYALLLGHHLQDAAQKLAENGAQKVFVYDAPELEEFTIEPYANAFEDFINRIKPSSILVGATNLGRSLAPRVAARFQTGLTADCTALEMMENTDLVQIRPAFGGNVMAKIITPNSRPQFCTVRYKIFSPYVGDGMEKGEIIPMQMPLPKRKYGIQIHRVTAMPKEIDIAEAEAIVAVGRGVKSDNDLEMARRLAMLLGAQLACSRPLVENGMFDAKRQIGLSGRTVKPKLLIALGISGAVQFSAGIQGADCVIAVNSDRNAPIFETAHYCLVGDLSEVLPGLLDRIERGRDVS